MCDCRDCQWSWLSEKGDKYDELDCLICDNGMSEHCGSVVGYGDYFNSICEDYEESL